MKVRSYSYTVPVDASCAACGLPFKAGDSVTLNPTRHRECDATAVFIDAAMARAFEALSRMVDEQAGDAS